jgi:hypothetical protein
MARGITLIKQSAVTRAARGLLAAASAAGQTGIIEVDLVHGIVSMHMTDGSGAGATTPKPANDINEWDMVKQ